MESVLRSLKRLLAWLGFWPGHELPGADADPYAWRPVPRRPPPSSRSGAVAVEEPDE
jgi:hypothetical protein